MIMKPTIEKIQNCFPFPKPRLGQLEIVRQIVEGFHGGYDHVLLDAPTATGKSPIAVAVSRCIGPAYILTSQKSLQDQYMEDFKKIGMVTVKGRANYPCTKSQGCNCDNGKCRTAPSGGPGSRCSDCPYETAKAEAYQARLSVLNYSYFLSMGLLDEESSPQAPRDLMVFDECHNLEKELVGFLSVEIDRAEMKELGITGFPPLPQKGDSDKTKKRWLNNIVGEFVEARLSDLEDDAKEHSAEGARMPAELVRKLSWFRNADRKIQELKDIGDKMELVVIHPSDFNISFKPLSGASMMEDSFFRFGKKFLYMSATTNLEQICEDTGLEPEKILHIKCPAHIPAENRPVFNMNMVSLSAANKAANLPETARIVKAILDKHPGERGIVHTVSYDIAEYLMENVGTDRFIMPRGKTRDKDLETFFESKKGDLVLISPSLSEGISLDEDLARFAVIVKLPYRSMGDPWVMKRKQKNEQWYCNQTALSLLQMSGRTVRSPEDFSKTYILDSSFDWFLDRNRELFPKWWLDGLKSRLRSGIELRKKLGELK